LALGEDARGFLAAFLECVTVQANPPARYRLNVAQGFLAEARQNLAARQWRACVGELGADIHIAISYGDEDALLTPWDRFDESDASRAVEFANEACQIAR